MRPSVPSRHGGTLPRRFYDESRGSTERTFAPGTTVANHPNSSVRLRHKASILTTAASPPAPYSDKLGSETALAIHPPPPLLITRGQRGRFFPSSRCTSRQAADRARNTDPQGPDLAGPKAGNFPGANDQAPQRTGDSIIHVHKARMYALDLDAHRSRSAAYGFASRLQRFMTPLA
jgi:hypothetical protein